MAAVTFFALTGHLPFVAHDPELQLWRQEQGIDWGTSWASRLPGPIRAWITRGLAFDPAERFESTAAMREAWGEGWRAVTEEGGGEGGEEERGKDGLRGLRDLLKASMIFREKPES
jgi:hypothetical protein